MNTYEKQGGGARLTNPDRQPKLAVELATNLSGRMIFLRFMQD